MWQFPGQYRPRPQRAGLSCGLWHLCRTLFGLRATGSPPLREVCPALAPFCCRSTLLICTPADTAAGREVCPDPCHRVVTPAGRWPRPSYAGCGASLWDSRVMLHPSPAAPPGCRQTPVVRLSSMGASQSKLCRPPRCSLRRCTRCFSVLGLCTPPQFPSPAKTSSSSLSPHSAGASHWLSPPAPCCPAARSASAGAPVTQCPSRWRGGP